MAEAYPGGPAPHNPQGPARTTAPLEVRLASPAYVTCETVDADVPWRQDVIREGFQVELKDRVVRPGARPGLGVEINEKEVHKHPFQQEVLQRTFYRDGSVGDW